MYKLKCKCLNITIHAQKGGEREAEGKTLLSEPCTASFFAGKILEVKLAVGGITKEVDSLISKSTSKDWNIYRCINCETDVYALHGVKGFDRVLASPYLKSDPEVIKKLENSTDFSPAFRIILKKKQRESSEEGSPVLVGQEQLTHSMNVIQESIRKYLKAEEAAMNQRIIEYTAKQQELYSSLKSRAFQDKATIFSVLSDTEERIMQNSLHDAMRETPGLPVASAPSTDQKCSCVPDFTVSAVPPLKHTQKANESNHFGIFNVGSPSRSLSSQRHRSHLHKIHVKTSQPAATDADPMFALDGFTDDCEPFFESEEEDSSDNSFQGEIDHPLIRNVTALKKPHVYSTSVPISLPTGTKKTSRSWEDDNDDETIIPEPSKIGESMRALARSVQGNSEDMFGELPRPRLFTEPRLYYS